jgi:Fe(3+) dicitrate transport protein
VEDGLQTLLTGSGLRLKSLGNHAWTLEPAPVDTESTLTVVGDWLGEARENDVFEHAGARDVIRRDDFAKTGATTMREVLNRIPGVNAPENTGTGSHDLAMNFGIRGLNPRLASRSTVLMDGIPVPFAPTVNLSYRWRRYRSATWMRWMWFAAQAPCVTGRKTWAAS